jgi:hypothetical protein
MVKGVGLNKAMTGGSDNKKKCSVLQLEISPARIHFLKFILEGYDGMALLSTVDREQGLVAIRYPPEVESDLKKLLHKIEAQIVKKPLQDIMS